MLRWRWDQGRILYFQFDVLREIAKVLLSFNGQNVNDNDCNILFRNALESGTGMPFSPDSYKVNRNYSRVFQCALLACTHDGGRLCVSDICKRLASSDSSLFTCDDYMLQVIKRFRYPFPAFMEYDSTSERVYPYIAILKLLLALRMKGEEAKIAIDDISRFIIGNNCTGREDIAFYKNLRPTDYMVKGDDARQLREMMVFISQLSILKAFNKYLYLDIVDDYSIENLIHSFLTPIEPVAVPDKVTEFVQMTKCPQDETSPALESRPPIIASTTIAPFIEFREGKRTNVQHTIIERSNTLRKFFLQAHPSPICDACHENMTSHYPWTHYMLDLHHLLPLSSTIRLSTNGTSLDDLVSLCPNCHRAIHLYYRKWLKDNSLADFRDKKEAMEVYLEAVKEIAS